MTRIFSSNTDLEQLILSRNLTFLQTDAIIPPPKISKRTRQMPQRYEG